MTIPVLSNSTTSTSPAEEPSQAELKANEGVTRVLESSRRALKRPYCEAEPLRELFNLTAENLEIQRQILLEQKSMNRLLLRAVTALEKLADDEVDDKFGRF